MNGEGWCSVTESLSDTDIIEENPRDEGEGRLEAMGLLTQGVQELTALG